MRHFFTKAGRVLERAPSFPPKLRWLALPILAVAFAVSLARGQLAPSAWPMLGHDLQHTALSPFNTAADASIVWAFTPGDSFGGLFSAPAIGADGTIYVGTYYPAYYGSPASGSLAAVNPDGSQKWIFAAAAALGPSSAIASDGTIYATCQDNSLYAVNPDGSQKWKFAAGAYTLPVSYPGAPVISVSPSAPAIGADGTIYFASADGHLYAINPNGSEEWTLAGWAPIGSAPGGTSPPAAPAIGSDGTIYVGAGDSLLAVSPGGSLNWSLVVSDLFDSPPAIGADGTIYVGSDEDKLYAVNPEGSEKWVFSSSPSLNPSPLNQPPAPLAIGADGTIYEVLYDGNLYALNPDGSLKWISAASGLVGGPAIGSDGTIYLGSAGGLYAINPDGSLKLQLGSVQFPTTGLSPAIGADGTVYFAGQGDDPQIAAQCGNAECSTVSYVYAVGPTPPTPTPSPTPPPTPTPTPTPNPANPVLALAPTAVNFGNVTVNTITTSAFTITNSSGENPLTGSVSAAGISAPFSLLSGGGAFSLIPHQSLSVTISFAPTAPGYFTGFVTITSNDPSNPSVTEPISAGTPTPTPTPIPTGGKLSLSTHTLNFGAVKISKSPKLSFTIKNTAKTTLYGDVESALSPPLSVTIGAGPFTLGHNQTHKVTVEAAPTEAAAFSATITIHSGDPKHLMVGVAINGRGKKVKAGVAATGAGK
jgi:outer membrane protein assembly factor BamB